MDSHYLIPAVYKTKEYPLGDMSQWDDYHLADQVAATHVAERGDHDSVGHMYTTCMR